MVYAVPKILIFSNNCFSKTNSNGRTLAKLLEGYPKERIAQFYIQHDEPDFERCDNYFKVTDSDALSAFIRKKQVGKRVVEVESNKEQPKNERKTKKRTPLKMLLRELVWKSGKWKGGEYNSWVESFSPDVVLIQAGDNAFLLKIATDLAKEKNIPLIVYNTEGYYFKKKKLYER